MKAKKVLEKHRLWVEGDEKGERADFNKKNLKRAWELLMEEDRNEKMTVGASLQSITVLPIKSGNSINLQLWGWAIVLNEDGTWYWEATDGG